MSLLYWLVWAGIAATSASAAPAAGTALDALDFDNGTLLVRESGSYGSDVASWSAWRLADGSAQGWCSPQNKPVGGQFEWQLDSTWTLETLAVDNTTDEEESYPGISAKSIDISVAQGTGVWKSLGKFALPKAKKATFALPKGILADRVRLDVLGNHGNAEYTEIAEIDLLGQRTTAVPQRKIQGVYGTSYGPMRFVQEGDQVYGCYDYGSGQALVWGAMIGRIAQVNWYEEAGEESQEGTALFAVMPTVAGELPRIWGVWFDKTGTLAGLWEGTGTEEGPKCTPQKKGALEQQLRKRGHVALYGIRFDSASDVPRPESEPVMREVAELLQANKAMHLSIEGHTDATNTAAYNLDLSQRRAKAVVAWLVKNGAQAGQLQGKGWRKDKPIADNATAQGRALNRRVEAVLQK